jgi:acetyltransferase-like isoleucine patch superfamily enzyme
MESKIDGKISAKDITIGKGVVVESGVVIVAEKVVLEDFSFIGRETRIIVPEFTLGEYTKLHAYSFAHGKLPMKIGRCCWIGGNVVLDSLGGLVIDDGVGIGAHSQIWTHAQFGDLVEGLNTRWYSKKKMHIGKDAWLVGHCIVSPVSIGEKSMALVGSVVTKDMESNHVYAGVPAKDITDKVGTQFDPKTPDEKLIKLNEIIDEFIKEHPSYLGQIVATTDFNDIEETEATVFNTTTRTYTKKYNKAEVEFLKSHVPLIKFYPE